MDTFPWERRRELGVGRAFAQTLTLSIRAPRRFYALAPAHASYWPAIVYGLAFELVVSLATFAHDVTVGQAETARALSPYYPQLDALLPGAHEQLEALQRGAAIGSLVTAPLSYLFELYATAALTWVGLRLARGLRTPFGHIVRLLAYASWVRLFGLLGVTGELALSALGALLTLGFASYAWVVLVRASQGIDGRTVIVASLFSTLALVTVGCVCAVPPAVAALAMLAAKLAP